ncbi:MAG: hypothetical protein ACLQVN_02700 [Bryobacteraceae bacterium]
MEETSQTRRRPNVLLAVECCACALLTAILIWPLFRIEYLDNWGSIDSTFIATARFLREHWPHSRWMPLWYCGTRFDYLYPPVLPYGTALLSALFQVSTARAYHLYTALFYCLGTAGTYALVRVASGSRAWAAIAAAATALVSPSYLFLKSFRDDSFLHMPQRLNVLVKWGEGPHMTALACLPFALLFCWLAIRDGNRRWLGLAAVCCALVVSNNFYGATSLALLFVPLAWALWITHRDARMWLRAAAIAAMAYGLTAFWLTPSYLRVTMDNLKYVAQPGNARSRWLALAVAAVFALASAGIAHRRKNLAYPVLVCASSLAMALNVAGNYYFGFRAIGEPRRLAPELDLVLILLLAEILRAMAGACQRWLRAAAFAAAVAALCAGNQYLRSPWRVFRADPNYRQRVEYRTTDWIARNLPGARVLAAGSMRFWYDAWHDGEQVGGGSDQGLVNGMLLLAQWQVTRDAEADMARDIAWLQGVGADAILVNQANSREIFHDYAAPAKFAGILPVIYDNRQGDVIYRVPRRAPAHARVVETSRVAGLAAIPITNQDSPRIEAYAAAVEQGPDAPVEMHWEGSDALRIRARFDAGESLLVEESFDTGWRARCDGKRLTIRKDVAGNMLVDVPPGDREVRLAFELPLENLAGRGLTAVSLALLVFCFWKKKQVR